MRSSQIRCVPGVAIATLALICAGCAPSGLSSVRSQMAAGQYAAARERLLQLKSHESSLTADQRREVYDDLCTVSFMTGRPQVPLPEQRRECAEAAAIPGSHSGQLLAQIDEESRREAARQVDDALKAGDLTAAEDAALAYRATAGSDPAMLAQWATRMWQIAGQQTVADHVGKHALTPAIAQLRRTRANVRHLSNGDFANWIRSTATVDGSPLIDRVDLSQESIKLWINESSMSRLALHLDRLAAINDGYVARCGCDARTDVGVADTGFPAYLVRLDPETRMSEVLILPHGNPSGPPV